MRDIRAISTGIVDAPDGIHIGRMWGNVSGKAATDALHAHNILRAIELTDMQLRLPAGSKMSLATALFRSE